MVFSLVFLSICTIFAGKTNYKDEEDTIVNHVVLRHADGGSGELPLPFGLFVADGAGSC